MVSQNKENIVNSDGYGMEIVILNGSVVKESRVSTKYWQDFLNELDYWTFMIALYSISLEFRHVDITYSSLLLY